MKTRRFGRLDKVLDERGQTMVEYAVVLALIAVFALLIIGELGDAIVSVFQRIVDEITAI